MLCPFYRKRAIRNFIKKSQYSCFSLSVSPFVKFFSYISTYWCFQMDFSLWCFFLLSTNQIVNKFVIVFNFICYSPLKIYVYVCLLKIFTSLFSTISYLMNTEKKSHSDNDVVDFVFISKTCSIVKSINIISLF